MTPILIQIPPGELMDRITILRLKVTHVQDEAKRARLRVELDGLTSAWEGLPAVAELAAIVEELAGVNARLWEVEDELRSCERRRDFGESFIEQARSVYRLNDRRSALKQKINQVLGSEAGEEKVYAHPR
jgi:hypothetical protein